MIRSARPIAPPVAITILTWKLFCFVRFWKVGTAGRIDNTCENCERYRSWLRFGLVDQKIPTLSDPSTYKWGRRTRPWLPIWWCSWLWSSILHPCVSLSRLVDHQFHFWWKFWFLCLDKWQGQTEDSHFSSAHNHSNTWKYVIKTKRCKTCVINDPLGQTHSLASSDHYFLLFWKVGIDGRHVQKQWSSYQLWVGRVDQQF